MNIKPKIISTEFLISPQNLCSAIFPISENGSPFFQLLISKTLKVPWLVSFSHTSHLIKSTAKLWWTYFQAVWLSLISSTAATLVQATIASLLELLQLLLRRFKCFHPYHLCHWSGSCGSYEHDPSSSSFSEQYLNPTGSLFQHF